MAAKNIQSLARGLDALEAVAGSETGLTLPELARRLGVGSTTAFNVGATLAAKGYLEKTSRPVRYCLGPAATRLAAVYERRAWLGRAGAAMLTLAQRYSGATFVLGELLGGEVGVVLRVDPERPSVLERPHGRVMSPYTSALVLGFLAFGSATDTAAYRRRHPFSEFGIAFWRSEGALASFLAESRSRGCVEVVSGAAPFRCAAPIYGAGDEFTACLGARFDVPSEADAGRALVEAVRAAARRVSGGLPASGADN